MIFSNYRAANSDSTIKPAPQNAPIASRAKISLLRALGIAAVATVAITLTACAKDTTNPDTQKTQQTTSSRTPAPSPTLSATPKATVTPSIRPCASLITNEQMYEFSPNVGVAPANSPRAKNIEAAAALGGTVCIWSNQSSGNLIELSVTDLTDDQKIKQEDLAKLESSATTTDQFFTVNNKGEGELQAFKGNIWIVLNSKEFIEAGDVKQLIDAVLGAL